jgi:hypothetical protein
MASSSAVELSTIDTRDVGEIERAVVAFARKPNSGLVVTASSSALTYRDQRWPRGSACRTSIRSATIPTHRTPIGQ